MQKYFIVLYICLIVLSSCVSQNYSSKPTTIYYQPRYSISLSKVERPEKASSRYGNQKIDTISRGKFKYIFEDDLVKIFWLVNSETIAFSIQNKTDHSIKIPWDEASFINENGNSYRVMHSGIKYNDRANPQAPSIIARKSSIEDIVFPTEYVYWFEIFPPGKWREYPIFPYLVNSEKPWRLGYSTINECEQVAKPNLGKTIQVLLPLQIEDVVNDYIFTFVVDKVSCETN